MTEKKRKPKKKQKKSFIQTSGKRKRAIARAVLKPGKGIIRINKKLLSTITPNVAQASIMEPLILAGDIPSTVNIDVHVRGGGWQGQAEAVRVAIGRALVGHDKKLKKIFLEYDRHILIQDVRRVEQSKPNDSKARKARQKSYR